LELALTEKIVKNIHKELQANPDLFKPKEDKENELSNAPKSFKDRKSQAKKQAEASKQKQLMDEGAIEQIKELYKGEV